ncbi:type I-MYXAN CRISPR-associated protein Cas6/Cmx6 [Leptolyngbya sp. ST-U4]|uniref:type I-MYXAN CRISPR-associated protein Cas6/Cmx6 n=1 Tax=Leptolyngbya sp. ST-U4 TaxID=2933912 RepID=UPI003296F7F9
MASSLGFATSQDVVTPVEPFVELSFPIYGKAIPADHNYALFAALVKIAPEIRNQSDLSILSIPGYGDKQGKILLTDRSCMRVRVAISQTPLVYRFAGKQLKLGVHDVRVGIPEVSTLKQAGRLSARIVTIKGFLEPESFIAAAQRQLERLRISGTVSIPRDRNDKFLRKTIKIQRFTVVGFTTEVADLNDEDSIRLQQFGIGGKRHMGCGFFLPCKEN